MRYIPNSPEEREEMLRELGLNSAEELFDSVPADIILRAPLKTPAALSEIELLERFEALAARNAAARRPNFLGAGAYSHYAPTIIDSLIQRSEFFTAYTPYQPEISQGTLQAIFEFQTLVCQLTGMDVANASMYDGSTAMAEAVLMAERVTRRSRVLVSDAVHPEYMQVAETYVAHAGVELLRVGLDEATGRTALDPAALDKTTAAVIVQSPNFFGCVEDLRDLAERVHAVGALLVVVVTESASFGLLRSP
ncbi:MAG: glycine dehydrogenase subunit 1, partial [Acidobacteriota bacterium]|nr:glycine dehydrogenase subunit 1 [Acidobacteriota bacterium]